MINFVGKSTTIHKNNSPKRGKQSLILGKTVFKLSQNETNTIAPESFYASGGNYIYKETRVGILSLLVNITFLVTASIVEGATKGFYFFGSASE